MEKNEANEEPKINYRGWKVMPFIIGEYLKIWKCFLRNPLLLFLTSTWCREWNFWEARSHWYLSQSLSLSQYCFQLGQYHSHKYYQHLQWQCQFIHLDWGFSLWHVFWPLQDSRILHSCFLSGLNLHLQYLNYFEYFFSLSWVMNLIGYWTGLTCYSTNSMD